MKILTLRIHEGKGWTIRGTPYGSPIGGCPSSGGTSEMKTLSLAEVGNDHPAMFSNGGVLSHRNNPNSWMVYEGKFQKEMDDDWRYTSYTPISGNPHMFWCGKRMIHIDSPPVDWGHTIFRQSLAKDIVSISPTPSFLTLHYTRLLFETPHPWVSRFAQRNQCRHFRSIKFGKLPKVYRLSSTLQRCRPLAWCKSNQDPKLINWGWLKSGYPPDEEIGCSTKKNTYLLRSTNFDLKFPHRLTTTGSPSFESSPRWYRGCGHDQIEKGIRLDGLPEQWLWNVEVWSMWLLKKVYVLKSDGLSLLLSLFIIKLLLLSALLVLLFLVVVIYCYHMGVSLSHGVPRYSRIVYHGKSC